MTSKGMDDDIYLQDHPQKENVKKLIKDYKPHIKTALKIAHPIVQ
jgi:hypothetical protein